MNEIINARDVNLRNSRILFDTNVWIFIFDFNARSMPEKMDAYSKAYSSLIKGGNTILVNDYIIGEFCNRCCKIQYDLEKSVSGNPDSFLPYKNYRTTVPFRQTMESVRDTCLNIVDDHEFINTSGEHYDVRSALKQFCDGKRDFSDIVLTDFCKKEDAYLMTDDRDFAGAGIRLITANRRIIGTV